MGLGILEAGEKRVPGTALMEEEDLTNTVLDPNLKYDLTGPIPIVLIPQPSDSPDDPLNWPLWQRDFIVFILCMISVLAATLGPLLAANTIFLTSVFTDNNLTDITLLTGWHLFGVGCSGFIFVATGTVWGKRHLYVLGTIIIAVSCLWGGVAQSYGSLLGARILQGVGVAPFEALVNASVGDLYHVHQRGKRMALSNLALYGGAFFTPVIVGIMTEKIGWRWPFYLLAIFSFILVPLVYLFVPETAYRRAAHLNTDIANISKPGSKMGSTHELTNKEKNTDSSDNSTPMGSPRSVEHNHERQFVSANFISKNRLRLFTGRKTDDTLWKLVLRPFPLFFHPAVFWGCLTQGALIGWTVMIGVDIAFILIAPPLWYTEAKTGYTYTGAFIGALLGFFVAGLLSDWSAKLLTKWNKGVYEPEFRILLVIPQMLVGVTGLYGFGWVCNDIQRYGAIWASFFFGLEVMGMIIGAVASALYVVDAHREISVEAFTCMLMFKNFFSFGLTWKAFQWLQENGIWETFRIIGSVQICVCLLSVPMYVFGKRNRALMARFDILAMLKLKP